MPATQRPSSAPPKSAFPVQRVWHGSAHGTKSKLPAVVSKNQSAVPAEIRRKRAIDAFFDQQQNALEAKQKRELKPGGSSGKPWDENPQQRFRLKHGIFDPEDASSCYYVRQSKEVHAIQLPSYKTDCPRGCAHNRLTTSPNETGGAVVGDTSSFFVEPLTRLMRDRWQQREAMRTQYVERHESRYPLRRLKDRSAQTLDNQYRQEMDPNKPSQTVMQSVLGGTFYDAPPTTKARMPRQLTPNYVAMNRKFVNSASSVVSMCKSRGTL